MSFVGIDELCSQVQNDVLKSNLVDVTLWTVEICVLLGLVDTSQSRSDDIDRTLAVSLDQ